MEQAERNPRRTWIAKRGPWLLLFVLAAIFAVVAGVGTARLLVSIKNASIKNARTVPARPGPQNMPGTAMNEPAPGFALMDQDGRQTSLKDFRGKVVVLTFIDPYCTDLCPLATRSMVEALRMLGPAAAAQVQLLGINANPQKTKVSDVADYTRSHKLEGRWRFLTGSPAQLESIWKAYHIFVAVEKDDIEHTAVTLLIDGNGNERNVLSTAMSYQAVGNEAHDLAAGIAQLLPEHPAVAASNEAASNESDQPDQPASGIATVNLTALGPQPQPVALGSAHPHLLLFFAGWLGQEPELKKNLAALDSYAAVARRHGWPSPVAVDVLPTESSAEEAKQALTPLAAALQTPIVVDASGALADDYHIDDLPWLVLSTDSGTILWSHDGWLSGAEVERQVRTVLLKRSKQSGSNRSGL
jgi:cytochrome oxidase Cu insertion factor (SCO1/SenC/PrrC family)